MSTKFRPDAVSLLDKYLEDYCRIFRFSGTLRITHGESIIYEKHMGMADIAAGVPIGDDTRFTFYSISKAFCAAAFLRLVEEGKADLDAHPGKYVPEAEGFDPRVTLRGCLCHTSGLPDFSRFPELTETASPAPLRRVIAEMTKVPSVFEPGTQGNYANINFALPALAVENISGMPYADYMRERIFAPMGAESAVIDRVGLHVPQRAQGYDIDGDTFTPATPNMHFMFGAGDVIGRVDDVYCLTRALKEGLVLSPEMWREVILPSPVSSYGMGCGVFEWHGMHRVNHSGGHVGFRTLHFYIPEGDFDVILMSNCGYGNSRNAIAEAIHAAFFGGMEKGETFAMDAGYIPDIADIPERDALVAKLPDRVPLTDALERRLLGEYDGLTFAPDGDGYVVSFDGGRKIFCYPIEGGILANRYADECYGYGFHDDGGTSMFGKMKK